MTSSYPTYLFLTDSPRIYLNNIKSVERKKCLASDFKVYAELALNFISSGADKLSDRLYVETYVRIYYGMI